jgi:hypothetical protein
MSTRVFSVLRLRSTTMWRGLTQQRLPHCLPRVRPAADLSNHAVHTVFVTPAVKAGTGSACCSFEGLGS